MWHFSPQLGNWLSCVAFLSDRQMDSCQGLQWKQGSGTDHTFYLHCLHLRLNLWWKHFPCYWPFVRGNHRSPVDSPHKGQWHGALMFSLIYVWTNSWANNWEAGDLRCRHAYYDVTVMCMRFCLLSLMHWLPWLCFSTAFWNAFPWEKGFVWFNFWSSLFIMDLLTII